MSTTHIGKIGRLGRSLRQILGERLEDGVPNKELVGWLNGLEHVQDILQSRFGGRAITEQNLSEWKQTGHVEWLRREERRGVALQLLEQREEDALEPGEAVAEQEVSDRLGRELGMEMARLALALVDQDGDPETRWTRLCGVYKEVSQLRRDDQRAERLRIDRERWQHELELEAAAAEAEEKKGPNRKLLALCAAELNGLMLKQALGGGRPPGVGKAPSINIQDPIEDEGEEEKAAAAGSKRQCHKGKKTVSERRSKTEEKRVNPGKSNQIQPKKFNHGPMIDSNGHQTTRMGDDNIPVADELAGGPPALRGNDETRGMAGAAGIAASTHGPVAGESDAKAAALQTLHACPDSADAQEPTFLATDGQGITRMGNEGLNDGGIRVDPSKSNLEVEAEQWLKAMNFV